jgi:hypothetical protein
MKISILLQKAQLLISRERTREGTGNSTRGRVRSPEIG